MNGQLKFGLGWWKTRCGWRAKVDLKNEGATIYCYQGWIFEPGERAIKARWNIDGRVSRGFGEDNVLDCVEKIVWPATPSNTSEEKIEAVENKIDPLSRQVGGDHYMNMGIQPLKLMEANFTPEKFIGFLEGNILKYTMRYGAKNGIQDLKKAQHYAELLTKYLEKQSGKQEG